ncbi:hypothetical protein [Nocardioides gilvus]|uniref:hypothetical protein n=1 Tax=Nocardioides gilvus TaxID=1735589 RepID=UPI0013A59517|nr:hypothetical protein [Nocardioides gilvus]
MPRPALPAQLTRLRRMFATLDAGDPSVPDGMETYVWITNPDGTPGAPDDDLVAPLVEALLGDDEGIALFARSRGGASSVRDPRVPTLVTGAGPDRLMCEVVVVDADELVDAAARERGPRSATPVWLWAADLSWVLHWWPHESYGALAGPGEVVARVTSALRAVPVPDGHDEPLLEPMEAQQIRRPPTPGSG